MTEIKELRIGNWIYLTDNDKNLGKKIGPLEVDVTTFNDIESSHYSIEAISLTEEILLKCGFEKQSDVIFIFENILLYLGDGFIDFYNYGHQIKMGIKYIHDLQNLYFALNNRELNVVL